MQTSLMLFGSCLWSLQQRQSFNQIIKHLSRRLQGRRGYLQPRKMVLLLLLLLLQTAQQINLLWRREQHRKAALLR
jgi:hypothetical protein